LRVVREDEWLVRRTPFDEWLTGDDPVPVVIGADPAVADTGDVTARLADAFTSAWPQTLQ
jgi:hypothetical protein